MTHSHIILHPRRDIVPLHQTIGTSRPIALTGSLFEWSELYRDGDFTDHADIEELIFQSVQASLGYTLTIHFTESEARHVLAQSNEWAIDIKRELK